MVNQILQGRLLQGFVGSYTEHKKIWSISLRVRINNHQKEIATVPYFEIVSDPTASFVNHNAALHAIKLIAINLGLNINNLNEFEPRCPSCTSHVLSEDIEGEYCCLNCGEEGPITQFYSGGWTETFINYHSITERNFDPPQTIAQKSEDRWNEQHRPIEEN